MTLRTPPREPYFRSYDDKVEWRRLNKRLKELRRQHSVRLAAGKISPGGYPPRRTEADINLFTEGDAERYLLKQRRAEDQERLRDWRLAEELARRYHIAR